MASLYCVPGVLQPQYFILLNSPKLYFHFFRLIKKSKIDKKKMKQLVRMLSLEIATPGQKPIPQACAFLYRIQSRVAL